MRDTRGMDGYRTGEPMEGQDFAFVPIEDLDAESPARTHRRELILGLLLVCALVGFGGWQWWDQGGKLGHYQAGQRAAAGHDWEAARVAYLAAGDYSDAAAQAARAATLIAQRQEQSQAALAAAQRADWPAALAAAQQVLQIVPDDAQIALIARTAATQTYALALSGTVALRTKATPPGLYYYGAEGWRLLASGDSRSRVRATCPNGDPIYDAPDPSAPPRAPSLTPVPQPGTGFGRRGGFGASLIGRRLLVGTRTGATRVVLAFDATQYYRFLCTDSGVWGFRFGAGTQAPSTIAPQTLALAVGYQAFGADRVITPAPPGPTWSVVALAPDGQHIILLNDSVLTTPWGWMHQLALATPAGQVLQPLPSDIGSLADIDVSPDGRFLVQMATMPVGEGVHRGVTLLGLTGSFPLTPVLDSYVPPGQTDGWFNLTPTFLRSGPRAGQLLLSGSQAGESPDADSIRLIDPAHPGLPLLTLNIQTRAEGTHFVRQDSATGNLLIGWPNEPHGAAADSTVAIIDADGPIQAINPPLPPWADLSNAWLRAGRLIYASMGAAGTTGEPEYTLRSVDLSRGDITAAVVYTSTIPVRSFNAAGTTNLRLGPGLLAYVTTSGELHARTYDGVTDVLLESGVAALYDLDADQILGTRPLAAPTERGGSR